MKDNDTVDLKLFEEVGKVIGNVPTSLDKGLNHAIIVSLIAVFGALGIAIYYINFLG